MTAPAGEITRRRRALRRLWRWALRQRTGLDVHPPLAHGERILASLVDAAGAPVMATTEAIYLGGCRHGWRRLGWVELGSVSWEPRRGILLMVGLAEDEAYQVRLGNTAQPPLAALAREQFDASRLISAPVPLRGGRTAAVIARRAPGSQQMTWTVRLPAGTDADDPDVLDRVATAIRSLRTELGL
jgi:hypothetical protein